MKEKNNQVSLFDTPDLNTARSTMDLSFPNKMTANFNKIVVTLMKYTMPGDSWHVKTDFFSRWLMMNAPVFSEYNIKFNTAYVANNQLWGGWQQFAGLGDDQAADYLLPGNRDILRTMQIPHFTTSDLAKWCAKKVYRFGNVGSSSDPVVGQFGVLDINPVMRRFFHVYLVPVLTQNYVLADMDWDVTSNLVSPSAEPNDSTSQVHFTFVVGTTQDKEYWDAQVQAGNVLDLTGMCYNYDANGQCVMNSSVSLVASAYEIINYIQGLQGVSGAPAFYCHGLNLDYFSNPNSYTMIELPKDVFFPSYGVDYTTDTLDGSYNVVDSVSAITSKSVWENYDKTRYFPKVLGLVTHTYNSKVYLTTVSNAPLLYPTGYVYSLLPTETMTSVSVYNTLNFQDIFNRTLGQCIIKLLMGAGTLTDYMGQSWSHQTIRQPMAVYKMLTNNYPSATNPNAQYGTYNETSDKYEIGIINSVPVTFLKYLAYHKVWNDYIRDNRFELREFYSDPYRSPFLRSNDNGSYISGNLIGTNNWSSNYGYCPSGWSSDPDYIYSSRDYLESQGYLSNFVVFGLDSIFSLLSLRERRVVHDFFTMVSPTTQFGDEAVTNVQVDSGGNSYVSTLLLRQATRLQKFLERSNFVGSDFVKQTLAHFGVAPDHCQHCSVRYLGGDKFTPTVSPVTMTAQNSESAGQVTGEQSAQMYSSGALEEKSFSCNESGVLIQLMTIQNDFLTTDRATPDPVSYFDFPLPEFADLGAEQLPYTDVVNLDNTVTKEGYTDPMTLFGYVPRYAKWKCSIGEIHGDFKKSLSYWVSKRQFDSDLLHGSFGQGKRNNLPECGKAFLYEKPDYNAFVYTGEEFDHALVDINQIITCSRLLPKLPSPNVL